MTLAELNDVPDDEEVSGEAKSRNQGELMVNLFLRSFEQPRISLGPIAACDTLLTRFRRKLSIVSPSGTGYRGNSYPRSSQLELQPRGKLYCVLDRSVTSRNKDAISRAGRRCRWLFTARKRPAWSSSVWFRTAVKRSRISRS